MNINVLYKESAFQELFKCCGSTKWANQMVNLRPFESVEDVMKKSGNVWRTCSKEDGLEAFTHHPKIGDLKSLEKKFGTTKEWAGKEQAGVNKANLEILLALANGNEAYEKKFGYIFIVCATGKSAEEMLSMLNKRIHNTPDAELAIAMEEQNKITKLRLEKLLS